MLVLSRKQKQQIQIGDQVVLTVLQIKGGSVRLGIEAPREIHVLRGELDEIRKAADMPADDTPQQSGVDRLASSDMSTEPGAKGRLLQLKIHAGVEDEIIAPTRLTEIAKAIPSLHLPR